MTLLEQIREEVTAGRVTEQTHPAYPYLSIFKYADSCSYEGGWNSINKLCRGLIIDTRDGSIVARSFPKFFNLGETPESSLENLPIETFEVFEKMDGSMGSIYFHDGKWRVATPGSMDSPQAREATSMLEGYATDLIPPGCTPVVEIIYPENRIVVDYGNTRALVLLAVFNHDGTEWPRNDVNLLAERCGFDIVTQHKDIDFVRAQFRENQEGYVVRFRSGLRVKIKSPVYVMAHRFLTNISIPRVIEACRDGSIAAVAAQCPETWRNKLDDLMGMVRTRFNQINAIVTLHWQKMSAANPVPGTSHDPKTWRKQFAIWIQTNVPRQYQSGVFNLLSNKDNTEWLWKMTEEELVAEAKKEPVNVETHTP